MVHPPFCAPEILIHSLSTWVHAYISQLKRLLTFNTNTYKNMQILACLQDEVRNGHYKYKIPSTGKHSDKVIVGCSLLSLLNACCPSGTALTGPHRNTFRLCFVLIMFKTKKSFQAVLTIFLKYNLQCTSTREWTKARLPAMLTKCSLGLLLWVSGSFALEFHGRGNTFLYKMIQWRQSGVHEKNKTTPGEASLLWGSPGITGLHSPRTCCSL